MLDDVWLGNSVCCFVFFRFACFMFFFVCVFSVCFHNNMVKSNKSDMGSGQETSPTVMLFKQIQTYAVD